MSQLIVMNEQKTLEPLPHPVYFVSKEAPQRWKEVINSETPPPVEQMYKKFISGKDNWSAQTYIQLKRRGLDVKIVDHFVPGQICVTSYDDVWPKELPFKSYVVVCRHDRGRPEICEQRIVQNKLNIIDHTDHFLPHWPQPNIIPRDKNRGTKIKNLVYQGARNNIGQEFQSQEFLTQLKSLDIKLLLGEEIRRDQENQKVVSWNDYTESDVVLAVRNCSDYILSIKPASKLINAWLAGCPALLGPEPAYQQLRQSELDYIEVRSPDDIVAALKRLQDDPALYAAMVENGFQRAKDFTAERIALLWRDLLAGPIAEGYDQWLSQSPIQKLIGRPAQFVWRSIKHKREKQHFFANNPW